MRLLATLPSPYARKARAAVIELGLQDLVAVEILPPRMPQVPKPDLDARNPLGKVPALLPDDGSVVADSPVIVAYLDALAGGGRLVPPGPDRWRALTLEALADGCMDAGVVIRVEQLKDEARRDPGEIAAYQGKIGRTLDRIEAEAGHWLGGGFDAGQLALACAVDWLVFRNIVPDPLAGRPRLADKLAALRGRPALAATAPAA